MTGDELKAIGLKRHGGKMWCRPFAKELGFHHTTIWKAARKGAEPVSREIQMAIKLLKKRKSLASAEQPRKE